MSEANQNVVPISAREKIPVSVPVVSVLDRLYFGTASVKGTDHNGNECLSYCRELGRYRSDAGDLFLHMMRDDDGAHYLVKVDAKGKPVEAFGFRVDALMRSLGEAMGVQCLTKVVRGARCD